MVLTKIPLPLFAVLYFLSSTWIWSEGAAPSYLLRDSFTVSAARKAGADLFGQNSEVGGATWEGLGKLVITADGSVTSKDETASMGILSLPKFDGALDLSADISPGGSGFTALAFLPGPSAGDFWNASTPPILWVFLLPNGDYEIRSEGEKIVLKKGTIADYAYKAGGPIHVDLICDPGAKTGSVKLNGTTVLENAQLDNIQPITDVGFRFNEKTVPGQPKVANFAVIEVPSAIRLKSESSLQYYVNPDEATLVHWSYSLKSIGTINDVVVRDYSGQDVTKLKPSFPAAGQMDVSVKLPQGYYTLYFPETKQEFGLVVAPAFSGKEDHFFGIDMALSQLVPFEQRADLISIVKRGGISSGRERLSWGGIQPTSDTWDWDASQKYETTRQLYQKREVGVLELFAGAPGWMEKDWRKFPQDLVGTEKAWEKIGSRFQPYWHGVEVWNEPDTPGSGGNNPADQYLPIVKAIRYALQQAKVQTPIGDGVLAYLNKPYLDLAARNGLLGQADFLSFHYYGEADNMEAYIREFRTFLKRSGNESMPLWLTEMGPPWEGIPNTRAPANDDADRALKFARNAVEAKACGIATIFPFILVNYSEQGTRVFGMLDAEQTPLRPMVTYLESIQMLSGTTYIGDLKGAPGSRVFQRDKKTAVVIYLKKGAAAPPFAVQEMRGIDGQLLKAPADGLTYLVVKMTDIAPILDQGTSALKLASTAGTTNTHLDAPSPVILAPSVTDTSVAKSMQGYQLSEGATMVSLHVRAVNLGKKPASLKVTISSVSSDGACVKLDDKDLTVPPVSDSSIDVPISIAKLQLDAAGSGTVQISAPGVSSAAVNFIVSRGLKEQLTSHTYQFSLPIGDLDRWKNNSAGQERFSKANGWADDVVFGTGDKWAFPRFTLPQEVDLSRVQSVLIRARCSQAAEVRVMTFSPDQKESYTPYSIIKADGQWHVALVPLESFLHTTGEPVGKQIHDLSIGINSEAGTNRLEVSDLYLLGK